MGQDEVETFHSSLNGTRRLDKEQLVPVTIHRGRTHGDALDPIGFTLCTVAVRGPWFCGDLEWTQLGLCLPLHSLPFDATPRSAITHMLAKTSIATTHDTLAPPRHSRKAVTLGSHSYCTRIAQLLSHSVTCAVDPFPGTLSSLSDSSHAYLHFPFCIAFVVLLTISDSCSFPFPLPTHV